MTSGQAPLVVQVFLVAPVALQGPVFLPVQEVHVPLGVQLVPVFLPVLWGQEFHPCQEPPCHLSVPCRHEALVALKTLFLL